jgi:hypothetical protein
VSGLADCSIPDRKFPLEYRNLQGLTPCSLGPLLLE